MATVFMAKDRKISWLWQINYVKDIIMVRQLKHLVKEILWLPLKKEKKNLHTGKLFTKISLSAEALKLNLSIFLYWQWIKWLWMNLIVITRSDKPTENYHQTLQSPSVLGSVLASFSQLFWFQGPQLYCFYSLSLLSSTSFQDASGNCFQKTLR